MSSDGRLPNQPDPVDPLALAEAVAAGRLGFPAAEAALWEARPNDPARAADDVAELRDLVAAIRGVRRHAEAIRRAEVEVFDADATSVPVALGHPVADDRGISPRRVRGGDVRLRPAARPRQRWAPVGALAALAIAVVVVALVGPGLLTSSVAASPSPSSTPSGVAVGSPSTTPATSPTPNATSGPKSPPPTPAATGVKGVPAIASEALAGAPGIAYWTLTAPDTVTVSEWRPDGGPPRFRFSVSTLADPDLAKGDLVDRRIVVSPSGRWMVFAETAPTARTRVFATDGSLIWTDPTPTFIPDIAWSADGSTLVIGSQPATWKILTLPATGGTLKVETRVFPDAAYRVLGFSTSGAVLYGWDTNGEAEYWQTPFKVVLAGGDPTKITRFSGQDDPLAVSNGTTDATQIDPTIHGWSHAGVDPKTGRVLDTGDLSGRLKGWELRDGSGPTDAKPLDLGGIVPALAWGPDGSIVVADIEEPTRAATIMLVAPEAPRVALGPRLEIAQGSYWRAFESSRGGIALLGLGSERSQDWLGADELVAIDLSTARSAVLVPSDPGLIGIHPAGWIIP